MGKLKGSNDGVLELWRFDKWKDVHPNPLPDLSTGGVTRCELRGKRVLEAIFL